MPYSAPIATPGQGIAGSGKAYSSDMWTGFDPALYLAEPCRGIFDQDEFTAPPEFAANSAAGSRSGKYNGLTTNNTGCIITPFTGQGGGVNLQAAASSGDNDETFLQYGGSLPSFYFATAAENDTWPYHHLNRVRFGTRFRVSTVAANVQAFAIGFADVLAAAQLADNTGELVATANFIGIQTLHGASAENATVKLVYQENGSTKQVLIATLATIVADKWYLFEMDIDPGRFDKSKIGMFYWNRVLQTTYLTEAQMAASTFPKSTDAVQIPLAPSWLTKSGADTARALTVGQMRWDVQYSPMGTTYGGYDTEACG